ncbi:MAG: tryptophan-rich sensory protein [Candidatus Pacearchaeota archaeon]|nr:tryptophan-rich sensory protein [Candidatus Pacearchaeota archaeon]
MKKRTKINWKVLIASFVAVYFSAFIGSLFTSGNVTSAWYESIRQSITPPNWIFPVVWNVLFFLIALSLYIAWTNSSKKQKPKLAIFFGFNLMLNTLWSLIFFVLKNPAIAFFELIIFWVSIVSIIFITWKINRNSAWLLFPYLLWVSFAGILNYLIAF